MSSYKNLELRDSIRRDALRLMQNENISYEEAFEKATKRLIGEQEILNFEFKPLTTINSLNKKDEQENDPYFENVKNRLKDIIDVDDYTNEQLEEYLIANEMGVDIKLFADKNYNPSQIKFLSLQVLIGESIDKYKGNYGFNPDMEFEKQLVDE